ncbi:MAG: MFS transporter [Paenibacillaceae bacterium]|nr:MFS transporter [Paenibacillaceae bacterium]
MINNKRNYRNFLIIWIGELLAGIGTGMTSFGLGVYVWQLTNSTVDVSMVELAALLPLVLLSPIAGVLADRFDRRLLMIIGDTVSALGLVAMLVIMKAGTIEVWQICLCVGFSSTFSSLLDPAYKATITDLLTKEEYSKATGMMSLASSAKFLISPALAGLALSYFNIELILIIDILTLVITVSVIFAVRKSLTVQLAKQGKLHILKDLKEGWLQLNENKGVRKLVILVTLVCFYLGFVQVLSKPMCLPLMDEKGLGIMQTICGCGTLLAGIVIGSGKLSRNYVNVMGISFVVGGAAMVGFGATMIVPVIAAMGFVFFATLPFADTSTNYLIRITIKNEQQGRVWGLIALISQLGYVLAYGISGILSDYVFIPALRPDGVLAGSVGKIMGTGETRGVSLLIMISGFGLIMIAYLVFQSKDIRNLEEVDSHIGYLIKPVSQQEK